MKLDSSLQPPSGAGGANNGAEIQDAAAAWVARCDAGLTSSEDAELKAWLAADSRHRTEFGEHHSAWATLDRPMQGGADEEVLMELHRLGRRQGRRRALLAAACCALLLGGVSVWTRSSQAPRGGREAIAASIQIILPARQTLSDGTIVELKEGAEIVPDFSAKVRRVTLRRGEAHFEVTKDATRPFVVETNGVEFRAVGTAFAVQLGTTAVELIVTEGRVAIAKSAAREVSEDAAGKTEPKAEPILGAGERAMINLASAVADVGAIAAHELSERLAWRAPRLEFSGTPLSDVVAALNQHAAGRRQVRFLIEDPSVAAVQVSGLFRADNTSALLDLLASGFGIVAEPRGESEIMLRKAAALR